LDQKGSIDFYFSNIQVNMEDEYIALGRKWPRINLFVQNLIKFKPG